MNKKKVFSYLFLGLLTVGSTGMVTSCKDYDDDIDNANKRIDDLNTALESCKNECNTNISSLKSQLETVNAQVSTLTSQLSGKADQSALQAEINRAQGQEAAITSQINTLKAALGDIENLKNGDGNSTTVADAVSDLYAKLQAVDTNLGTALTQVKGIGDRLTTLEQTVKNIQEDLKQQQDALDQLKNLDSTLTDKINAAKDELQKQIDTLATAKSVEDLQAIVNNNVKRIDALNQEVDVLNILVEKSLRGLVFIPDAYYYGIEATKISVLDYLKFDVPATAWNKTETKGYTDHARYDSTSVSRVLNFVAKYHMNPSSADTTKFGKLTVLTDDKPYVTDETRAAASAPFEVVSKDVKDGDLIANIKINDPSKIKTVKDDQAVTVFALQVNTNKTGDKDTTITSDYATLYKETIKDLKLYHAAGEDVPFTGIKNSHDPSQAVANHTDNGVLMQTAHEAGWDFGAQDTVVYNGTLDLSKLVEVHYTQTDGKTGLFTDELMKANGIHIEFALTGLYYGGNNTSESAHAALNGTTFRPQMPEYDANHVGIQQAYGAKQDRQEIGRTPLVRVELKDADGNVLDYGYIRIRIADPGKAPKADEHQDYTLSGWTYSYECEPKAWADSTKWIQTEYDLYNKVGLTRDEFEANYDVVTDGGAIKQYNWDAKTNTASDTNVQTVGIITRKLDNTGEVSAQTNVLKWNITGAEMKKLFVDGKATSVTRAIKFQSKDKTVGPDIYVIFTTGNITINPAPTAVANLDANKIEKMWYATNTNTLGKDEVHANTLTPEDNANGTATALDDQFSDLFEGNLKTAAPYIGEISNLNNANRADYAKAGMKIDFVFDKSNEGRPVKGIHEGDVVNYILTVADNGKTLKAYKAGELATSGQTIATIEGNDASDQTVKYHANNDHNGYSEDILNYKAHNELDADGVLNVTIGMLAQNKCAFNVPLTENTFNVRFLRPLNVFDNGTEIEDAASDKVQTIDVTKLVQFTDWRDVWDNKAGKGNYSLGAGYTKYYGITSIDIPGVGNGQNLSQNSLVKTNLNGDEKPLSQVSTQVQFTYNNGVITYKNLSSTVHDFYVTVPVAVHYLWGTVYQNVTINVKKSLNNAKRH